MLINNSIGFGHLFDEQWITDRGRSEAEKQTGRTLILWPTSELDKWWYFLNKQQIQTLNILMGL